jgi:hypothetical protein
VANRAREGHIVSANPSAIREDASCDLWCPKTPRTSAAHRGENGWDLHGPSWACRCILNWDMKLLPLQAVLSDRHRKGPFPSSLSTISLSLSCLLSCIVIARRGTRAPNVDWTLSLHFCTGAPAKPVEDAKVVIWPPLHCQTAFVPLVSAADLAAIHREPERNRLRGAKTPQSVSGVAYRAWSCFCAVTIICLLSCWPP